VVALDFVKCSGCADAGLANERNELASFFQLPVIPDRWRALHAELRAVYDAPDGDPHEYDARIWAAWSDILHTL
jgi:hypothetical protein